MMIIIFQITLFSFLIQQFLIQTPFEIQLTMVWYGMSLPLVTPSWNQSFLFNVEFTKSFVSSEFVRTYPLF